MATIICIRFKFKSTVDRILLFFIGKHVINLFIQYTPYSPSDGSWGDPAYRVSYILD